VSVLDGGLVSWILQGRKVVNNSKPRLPVAYVIDGAGRRNEAQLADVRTGNGALLDTRSEEEYVGDPRYRRTGHVPGARWLNWEDTVSWEQGFRRQPEEALRAKLAKLGVANPQQPVIAYCRSGHRAAQMYLTLRSLGFSDVRLYANSMNEYGLKPDAPLKLGPAP
jgi:thiosulfate/3-mercaptopyruvate sulfurtransferase